MPRKTIDDLWREVNGAAEKAPLERFLKAIERCLGKMLITANEKKDHVYLFRLSPEEHKLYCKDFPHLGGITEEELRTWCGITYQEALLDHLSVTIGEEDPLRSYWQVIIAPTHTLFFEDIAAVQFDRPAFGPLRDQDYWPLRDETVGKIGSALASVPHLTEQQLNELPKICRNLSQAFS